MKRKCILMLGIILSCSLFAISQTEKKAKSALLIASLTKMSNVFGDEINLQPAEYILDAQGKIVGQNFLYPAENKYYRIDLIWNGDNVTNLIYNDRRDNEGKISKSNAKLVWDGNNLQNIKVDGVYRFDYSIKQMNNSILITQKDAERGLQIVYEAIFEGDKLKRLEKQLHEGSKKIINGTIEYGYLDNKYSMHIMVAKQGKPLKPKSESTNVECYYKELSANSFEIMGYQNGEVKKMQCDYNKEGLLVSRRYPTINGNEEKRYVYIDNRLFQEIAVITKDGKSTEKKMRVYFDNPNQDEAKPVYDNKKGDYKFDSKDDLVYERRDMKSRTKINGVWTDWQQVQY